MTETLPFFEIELASLQFLGLFPEPFFGALAVLGTRKARLRFNVDPDPVLSWRGNGVTFPLPCSGNPHSE
jgi:hypothetical protein